MANIVLKSDDVAWLMAGGALREPNEGVIIEIETDRMDFDYLSLFAEDNLGFRKGEVKLVGESLEKYINAD